MTVTPWIVCTMLAAAPQQNPAGVVPAAPATAGQAAQPAPAQPLYDESADAPALIAAALGRATGENRRVLLEWGANDSEACQVLRRTAAKDRDVAKTLQ